MTETNNEEILKEKVKEFDELIYREGTPAVKKKWEEVKEAIYLVLEPGFPETGGPGKR